MASFVEKLAENTWRNIEAGYYSRWLSITPPNHPIPSLRRAIEAVRGRAIVAEIKYASPSAGKLRNSIDKPIALANAMLRGGAVAISVLTEPTIFKGGVENLYMIAGELRAPTLMKDIVVSKTQIDVAKRVGASAVLLILRLFNEGLCESELENMIRYANMMGLEVVLETHGRKEFEEGLSTNCDILGINNRDLATLTTRIETTIEVLSSGRPTDRIVMSESGITSVEDIRRLRQAGADAFLVGSSIMSSSDVEAKVRELAEA